MTPPMEPPVELLAPLVDEQFAPLLIAIRDCLEAELSRSLAGPVCRAYVEWRSTPPVMDGCHCECADEAGNEGNGDAWVRLARLAPDSGTGSFTTGRNAVGVEGCAASWFATIGIGSYRCIPIPQKGEPLPEETVNATSLMLHGDLAAYLRVLACCALFTGPESDYLALGPPSVENFAPIRAADCGGGELLFRLPVRQGVRCPPWPSP